MRNARRSKGEKVACAFVGKFHTENVRTGLLFAPDDPRSLQRGIARRAEPAKIRR